MLALPDTVATEGKGAESQPQPQEASGKTESCTPSAPPGAGWNSYCEHTQTPMREGKAFYLLLHSKVPLTQKVLVMAQEKAHSPLEAVLGAGSS